MSDASEEFNRYNEIAKQRKSEQPAKEKVKAWKLIFNPTKEMIIRGAYSLCQWKKSQFNDIRYKIVPDVQ